MHPEDWGLPHPAGGRVAPLAEGKHGLVMPRKPSKQDQRRWEWKSVLVGGSLLSNEPVPCLVLLWGWCDASPCARSSRVLHRFGCLPFVPELAPSLWLCTLIEVTMELALAPGLHPPCSEIECRDQSIVTRAGARLATNEGEVWVWGDGSGWRWQ